MRRLRGWVFAGCVALSGLAVGGCSGGSGEPVIGHPSDGGPGSDSGSSASEDSGQSGGEAGTPIVGDSGTQAADGGSADAAESDAGEVFDGGSTADVAPGDSGGDSSTMDGGSDAGDAGDAGSSPAPAPAVLVISDGPTYAFGSRTDGAVVSHTFTVTNTGGTTATSLVASGVTGAFAFAGASYPGSGGTCATTLAAGTVCTVTVQFAPTTPGSASATMSLAYFNGSTTPSATRALSGTGVAGAGPAVLAISDGPTYDFGSITDGVTVSHTFTVGNTGGTSATSLLATGVVAPFSFVGGYPGTAGTCTGTLAAGSNCTLTLTYAPASPGGANITLALGYNDGTATQSATRAVTGTGATAAVLAISDGPTYGFGTQADGVVVSHPFTVSNTGGSVATGLAASGVTAPFSFAGGAYPGTGGNCATTLGANSTCTVVVAFAPTSPGLASATMSLAYADGQAAQSATRPVSGTGVAGTGAAVLSISDGATFAFGSLTDGLTASHTFTVGNSGGAAATSLNATGVTAPFSFLGGSYPGTGGSCGATLAAGSNCAVVLAFAPTTPGPSNITLSVGYNDGTTTQTATRPVTGTGIGAAVLAISDGPTYSFGTVALNGEADHLFYVTNTGAVPASAVTPTALSLPFAFKGGAFPGTEGTCGSTVQPGDSCVVEVSFTPTQPAAASSALTLDYSDGATTRTASRGLGGVGTTVGVLAIADWPPALYSQYGLPSDPATFDFGARGLSTATDHTFYVTNTGAAAVSAINGGTLSAPFAYKGGTFPGAGGGCGSTLTAGATCAVVVTFTPTTAATTPETLSIGYSDGVTTQTATRAVTGTGTAGAALTVYDYDTGNGSGISLTPVFDFGSRGLGGTVSHPFVVVNGGGGTAVAMGGSLAPPFAFEGGTYPGAGGNCGTSLAPASECTIVISFEPTVTGLAAATVNIGYKTGSTAGSATRLIQGTGITQALLAIGDDQLPSLAYSFGTVASGTSVDASFTVTNQGASAASAISAGGLAAPFTFKGGSYPGTGGSCGTTLAASAHCVIVVTFSPTGSGFTTTAVALSYYDSANTQIASRSITGTGTTAALLSVSQCSNCGNNPTGSGVASFGTSGTPVDQTFYVTNTGAQSATSVTGSGLTAPFAFKGTSNAYPGYGGTCGSTIAVGATCTVVVTFTPSGNATSAETLNVGYYDGSATQSVTLSVSGTSTTLAILEIFDSQYTGGVSSSPYSFGTAGVPQSNTFYVKNVGAQSATLIADGGTLSSDFSYVSSALGDAGAGDGGTPTSGFAFAGGFPGNGPWGAGTCTATLATGATCTIVVTFTPSGSGTESSVLTLDYNNGSTTQTATRALTGTATTEAVVTIYDNQGSSNGGGSGGSGPPPYDFGLSGIPVTATFNVQNSGGGPATFLTGGLAGTGFSFAGGYPGNGGTCSTTIGVGVSCSVVVTYTPSGSNPQQGTLTIGYSGGSVPTVTRSLTGTPTTQALLVVSDFPGGQMQGPQGSPYNYGTSGVASDHTFYVTNTGGAAATAINDGGTLGGAFAYKGSTPAYPGAGGTCTGTLAVGASCMVVVTYTPSGNGVQTGTLTLGYAGGSTPTATRALTGTGTTMALLALNYQFGGNNNGMGYDFGTTGIITTAIFEVSNIGGAPATSVAGGPLGNGFSFVGGYPGGGTCTSTIAVGAAPCSVIVTYTPSGTVQQSSTLTIDYSGGSSPSVTEPLTGTPTSLPILSIDDYSGPGQPGGLGQPPFDYGTWGVATTHTFYVNNAGGAPATSIADGLTLGNGFSFAGGYPGGGTCTASLTNGPNPCTIIVTYTPSGTTPQSSTITLSYSGGSSPTATRSVTGTPTSRAYLTVSEYGGGPGGCGDSCGPYGFPTIAAHTTTTHMFTVTNSGHLATVSLVDDGGLTLPFGYANATFPGTFPGTTGTCTGVLAAGSSCTLNVEFAPTATGTSMADVLLLYSDSLGGGLEAGREVQGTAQ